MKYFLIILFFTFFVVPTLFSQDTLMNATVWTINRDSVIVESGISQKGVYRLIISNNDESRCDLELILFNSKGFYSRHITKVEPGNSQVYELNDPVNL